MKMTKRLTAVLTALLMLCMCALPASADLNTGHLIDVEFKVLYVDDSFRIGYNYGSGERTKFVCQYTEPHSDTAYTNHIIAISDIKAAAGRATVDEGYSIVGWSKEANANPTIWSLTRSGDTACNKGTTIYLVAKKPGDKPTAKPSDKPTDKPTEKPTEKPSEKPTEKPTEKPSEQPTEKPTEKPSEKPTEKPTEKPSEQPTEKPTEKPSEQPTEKPTEKPSEQPTEKPTEAPAPTWTPDEPQGNYISVTGKTRVAGEEAVAAKSGPMFPMIWYYPMPADIEDTEYVIPELSELFELNEGWKLVGVSVDAKTTGMMQPGEKILLDAKGARLTYYFDRDQLPVEEPTATPTAAPTTEPTTEPTAAPTTEPTSAPTEEPTVQPTTEPTAAPTTEPTVVPTAEPTAEPTVAPTTKPGKTDIPKTSDRTYPVQMALLLGGAFCLLIAAGTGIKSRNLRKGK